MRRTRPTNRLLLWSAAAAGLLLAAGTGCLGPGVPLTAAERAAEAAARPILQMDPEANWTACFNRLVELGPASVSYLARQPLVCRRTAPDDLRVALHVSLLRLLANPSTAPRQSMSCLETTLDVLHCDLKVRGRRLGTPRLADGRLPRAWHDLYPADFNHAAATQIDLEADRQAIRHWWRAHAAQPSTLVTTRKLNPRPERLWRLLSRRYADRWTYQPEPGVILCGGQERGPEMIRVVASDYNLVRATCIWLGSSSDPAIQGRLIELVGSSSPVVAHNARFALGYCPDRRIRATLLRFGNPDYSGDQTPPARPRTARPLKL